MTTQPTPNRFEALSGPRQAALLTGVFLVAILLLGLAAEAAVRLRAYMKHGSAAAFETSYSIDPATGLRLPLAGFSDGRIRINSDRFRGPEIVTPKPDDVIRIAFLGASTTYCADVSGNDQVWPHLVIERLAKAHPDRKFDYVNAGVPGYTLPAMIKQLTLRVAPLRPDIVVFYEATNDLTFNSRALAAAQGIDVVTRDSESLSFMERHSMLWYLVSKNLEIRAAKAAADDPHRKVKLSQAAVVEPYERNLAALATAAKSITPDVALVTFAPRIRADMSKAEQQAATSSALYFMPFMSPTSLIQGFDWYNEALRRVAGTTRAHLIEAEGKIPPDDVHYADSVHFLDPGSQRMADIVAEGLAPLVAHRIQPPQAPVTPR